MGGRFVALKPPTQVIVVCGLNFYSGTREKKFEKHYFRHMRKLKGKVVPVLD
jgi:hypothetical protein